MKVIYKPNLETLEEGDTLPEHFTEGKIYTTIETLIPYCYKIKCDYGLIRYVLKEDFIPVSKYRKSQINNLLK